MSFGRSAEDDYDLELLDREPRDSWEYDRKKKMKETGRDRELLEHYRE
jgi:hypothetical protein